MIEEVKVATDVFPNVRPLSSTSKHILNTRYMWKDEKTWDDLTHRVVNFIVPRESEDFLLTEEMIMHRYFIPNSPCLANAGKENGGLCACYVIGYDDDSIESIIKVIAESIWVARRGGGLGLNIGTLRPKGDPVLGSTHGIAGGALPFANIISETMKVITQGGLRPMALMFTMSVYHPEILDFITAKINEHDKKIENANMSVVVDDAFMQAVKDDKTFWTEFNGKKYQEFPARQVFDMIVEGGWGNGEPGLLFKNRINNSPYHYTGQEITSTNPCAEQPLPKNGVCNLGSIDLSKFVNNKKEVNLEQLELAVRLGVRFLDRVVDKSVYPTKEIETWAKENRAIGLGVMGFADYLLVKEIAYGSDESLKELDFLLSNISLWADDESKQLGKLLGVPKQCKKLPEPRRNITVTTIAPTGTIGLIADTTTGIEPHISQLSSRKYKNNDLYIIAKHVDKPYFRCAISTNGEGQEVTWEEHIKVLATAQRWIDSGVSKTINFPKGTHKDTIWKAFIMAWEMGCKGLAVYRNESRTKEVLTPKNIGKDKCPLCDSEIVQEDGYKKCTKCDWKLKL